MTKVVVFGECMVELVSGQEDILHKGFAGDTYNTAVYLKRCASSVSVSFLTALGSDFLSDELLFKMGDELLNTEYVFRSEDRNLGLYMVRTDDHGERNFAYWRQNSAATQTINLLQNTKVETDFFYFSAISLAILDIQQRVKLFALIKQLKAAGCKISFDPNYRPKLWVDKAEAQKWTNAAYAISDLVFPGGDDHLQLYGHINSDDIFKHLAEYNIAEIVVKNGSSGVHILTPEGQNIVPIEAVKNVVDTTAAGDAFNGGYLASRLSGGSVTDAASYGAKVAATVIGYPGAIIADNVLAKHVKYIQ